MQDPNAQRMYSTYISFWQQVWDGFIYPTKTWFVLALGSWSSNSDWFTCNVMTLVMISKPRYLSYLRDHLSLIISACFTKACKGGIIPSIPASDSCLFSHSFLKMWIHPVSFLQSLEIWLFSWDRGEWMLNESMCNVMVEIMFMVWPWFHGIFPCFIWLVIICFPFLLQCVSPRVRTMNWAAI